jgi:hypothetical protein
MNATLLSKRANGFLPLVFVLMCGLRANAIDINEPARIRVLVKDADDKPIQGAAATLIAEFASNNDETPIRAKTNAQGVAELQMRHPHAANPADISWHKELRVEADGMMTSSKPYLGLFPGGQFEETFVLQPRQTTLIRLRDANGKPVPGVNLFVTVGSNYVSYREDMRTNGKGEYLYVHPPLKDWLHIRGNSFHRVVKNAPEVTITLSSYEKPEPAKSSRLTGKALLADGKPAVGWFVTREAKPTGVVSYGGPGLRFHSATDLVRLGTDGGFVLDRSYGEVFVISPEGIPFRFCLGIKNYSLPKVEQRDREVTLRLPPLRRIHHGRLVYADGDPAVNVAIAPEPCWDLDWNLEIRGPDENLILTPWRAVAAPGGSTKGLVTDEQGRFEVPIYAGMPIQYRVNSYGWANDDVTKAEQTVLRPSPRLDPLKWKRVILDFTDAQTS